MLNIKSLQLHSCNMNSSPSSLSSPSSPCRHPSVLLNENYTFCSPLLSASSLFCKSTVDRLHFFSEQKASEMSRWRADSLRAQTIKPGDKSQSIDTCQQMVVNGSNLTLPVSQPSGPQRLKFALTVMAHVVFTAACNDSSSSSRQK